MTDQMTSKMTDKKTDAAAWPRGERHVEWLVVGAGPAGCAAAIGLQRQGRDCLLVEARRFPRMKLCGGLLTKKSQRTLRLVLGGDEGLYRECLSACLMSRERSFSLWGAEGECVVEVEPREPIVLVDRPRLDEWLARHFERLGGRLLEGDGLAEVDFAGRVATLASGQRIRYDWLVAADGAMSRVRRGLMDFDPEFRAAREKALRRAESAGERADARDGEVRSSLCEEINLPRQVCPSAGGVQIHFGVVPWSYAWSFAKGDTVCTGLLKVRERIRPHIRLAAGGEGDFHPKRRFWQFLGRLGVGDAERHPVAGAPLPLGCYMKRPARLGHVFVVGDAAGLVEPLTGEGIYFALQSGYWAAESRGDTRLFMREVRRLQRLIEKGWWYHRWLMRPEVLTFVCRHARRHAAFFEHFYSTQIEEPSLDSFLRVVWDYKRAKRRRRG